MRKKKKNDDIRYYYREKLQIYRTYTYRTLKMYISLNLKMIKWYSPYLKGFSFTIKSTTSQLIFRGNLVDKKAKLCIYKQNKYWEIK